jgi:PhnB protein
LRRSAVPDVVKPVPEGLHTVTPRLVLSSASAAIDFYVDAFEAEEIAPRSLGPDGAVVHAEVRIGDSVVYLTDEGDDGNGDGAIAPTSTGGRVTAIMAITVPDVDRLWERAVAAGCEVIYPLGNQFYGDRGGRLRDPFGHQWMLSTHIEDVDAEELERRMQSWSDDGG